MAHNGQSHAKPIPNYCGDTFIELRKATFLTRFDKRTTFFLTSCASFAKILGGKECGTSSIAAARLPLFHFQRGKSQPTSSALATYALFSFGSLTETSCLKLFRISTCKSASKETTLTTFRINTYEKQRRRAHFAQIWWSVSPFRINTYRNVRKC